MPHAGMFFFEPPLTKVKVLDLLDGWVSSPALGALVEAFGGNVPTGSLEERVASLVDFSRIWDFRSGSERVEMVRSDELARRELELRPAFQALGLKTPSVLRHAKYDRVVVLGGTLLSCMLRTEFAAELLTQQHITTKGVALLGTDRKALAPERTTVEDAGLQMPSEVKTEFEALALACSRSFNATYEQETEDAHGIVRHYSSALAPIDVLSTAPLTAERIRANTDDTYHHFARHFGLTSGQSILICTSQIYAPFQFFGAIRMLSLRCDVSVEVVGYPPDRASKSGSLQHTENFLQETRSALRAAHQLLAAL